MPEGKVLQRNERVCRQIEVGACFLERPSEQLIRALGSEYSCDAEILADGSKKHTVVFQ